MANTQEEIKLYPIQDCSLENNRVSLLTDPSAVKDEIGRRVPCPAYKDMNPLKINFHPSEGVPDYLTVRCPKRNRSCRFYKF